MSYVELKNDKKKPCCFVTVHFCDLYKNVATIRRFVSYNDSFQHPPHSPFNPYGHSQPSNVGHSRSSISLSIPVISHSK